jgi:hypothetical protein
MLISSVIHREPEIGGFFHIAETVQTNDLETHKVRMIEFSMMIKSTLKELYLYKSSRKMPKPKKSTAHQFMMTATFPESAGMDERYSLSLNESVSNTVWSECALV